MEVLNSQEYQFPSGAELERGENGVGGGPSLLESAVLANDADSVRKVLERNDLD